MDQSKGRGLRKPEPARVIDWETARKQVLVERAVREKKVLKFPEKPGKK